MQLKFTKESDFRQERDFGAKISASFEFIGAHWQPLSRCLIYFVLPAALLMGIFMGLAQTNALRDISGSSTSAGSFSGLGNQFGAFQWLGLLASLISYALLAATVYGYVNVRMTLPPEQEVTPALVGGWVKRDAPRMAVSGLVVVVFIFLGFVLLAIPGIYLSIALSMIWAIQSFERKGMGNAINRNISLIRGKWWSTFGLSLIVSILVALLGMVFQIPQLVPYVGKILNWDWADSSLLNIAGSIVASAGGVMLYTLLLVALMFQYFNLVERKEGIGLRTLVDSLGNGPAPVAHNHAYRPDDEGEY
ncbi:hypothetical protein J0X19_12525 [Hymenobacter sp. BT186]|uniref:Glycerophosphoryl diester phosphodiesterase membrane domain-containing protein n=1 Tax=Hymenobacter telluris TaxID=2816474 RepID=A0A939EY93_9BACT|nr:hypothetical protein [Hymenobacter telluris]MBO0358775.1 hypothetical protein [Hymenobacter telluris]MBW3374801.1 hypothetical protein [Hymenobacter norwichensis]